MLYFSAAQALNSFRVGKSSALPMTRVSWGELWGSDSASKQPVFSHGPMSYLGAGVASYGRTMSSPGHIQLAHLHSSEVSAPSRIQRLSTSPPQPYGIVLEKVPRLENSRWMVIRYYEENRSGHSSRQMNASFYIL